MKKATVLITGLILGFTLFGQDVFEFQEKQTVKKNQIKRKIQMNYNYVNGEVNKDKGYVSSITEFDMLGNVTEIVNYRSNGQILSVINYKYDGNGNKLEYIRFKGNREKLTYRQSYTYNDQGLVVEEKGFDGASKYTTKYSYNSLGRPSQILYYTGSALVEKKHFSYNGNIASIRVENAAGELQFYHSRKYDHANRILEDAKYTPDNTLVYKMTYNYDSKGNVIEETKYVNGSFDYRMKNDYQDNQLQKILKENPGVETFITNKYVYDDEGNLVEELWKKDNSNNFSKKTYQYDSNGKCTAIDCYYASYNFKVHYALSYEL